jgi:hypothetical protein
MAAAPAAVALAGAVPSGAGWEAPSALEEAAPVSPVRAEAESSYSAPAPPPRLSPPVSLSLAQVMSALLPPPPPPPPPPPAATELPARTDPDATDPATDPSAPRPLTRVRLGTAAALPDMAVPDVGGVPRSDCGDPFLRLCAGDLAEPGE